MICFIIVDNKIRTAEHEVIADICKIFAASVRRRELDALNRRTCSHSHILNLKVEIFSRLCRLSQHKLRCSLIYKLYRHKQRLIIVALDAYIISSVASEISTSGIECDCTDLIAVMIYICVLAKLSRLNIYKILGQILFGVIIDYRDLLCLDPVKPTLLTVCVVVEHDLNSADSVFIDFRIRRVALMLCDSFLKIVCCNIRMDSLASVIIQIRQMIVPYGNRPVHKYLLREIALGSICLGIYRITSGASSERHCLRLLTV